MLAWLVRDVRSERAAEITHDRLLWRTQVVIKRSKIRGPSEGSIVTVMEENTNAPYNEMKARSFETVS